MTSQSNDQETEITALVISKDGKRSANGNGYYEYSLQEVGKDFEVTYRQFDNVETGKPVAVGETWRFLTYLRPAARGNYHNIRNVLGQVVDSSFQPQPSTDDFGPDPEFDGPPTSAPKPVLEPFDEGSTPTPTRASNPPPAGFQREAHRYIAGNSANSISIERQVSLKPGVDLMALRVRVLESALNSGMAQTVAEPDDPLGLGILDMYWGWVVQRSIGDISGDASDWLEYNNYETRKG